MKNKLPLTRRILFILLAITFFTASSFVKKVDNNVAEPKKLALIIAIGNYNTNETGWAQISSQNDVPIIKSALEKIGFAPANIDVLQDAAATRQGILNALTKVETKAALGDMVTIHISSHGQQISDNQPPDEIDGYDEAIVAFGAPVSEKIWKKKSRGGSYDGSLHLRDEDLGAAINDIRAKVGKNGHVLVVLDACHSGTGTRGSSKVRGGEDAFVFEGAAKPTSDLKREEGGFGVVGEGQGKTRGAGDNLGKFILISGAAAEEVNYEYEEGNTGYGSLSFCISKILPSLPKGASYRTLFAKLQAEMADKAPKQSPQLEGDVDYEVFGGSFKAQQKYFNVLAVVNDKELKINAGKLMGVTEGSIIQVETAGTANPSAKEKALATGKITSATQLDAVITLDKAIDASKNKANFWVFVISPSISETKIKVDVSKIKDAEFRKTVTEAINKLGMAEVVAQNAELQIKEEVTREAPALSLENLKYGSPVNQRSYKSTDPKAVASITKDIQNYAQGKLFKELDEESASYKVVITRLIPSSTNKIADTVNYTLPKLSRGNILEIPTDEAKTQQPFVFIEVQNQGDKVAYFNIIDIEPTGAINPIFPPRIKGGGVEPKEVFKLFPGDKKVFNYAISIAPPFGVELFKVIATDAPFDLTSTIMTRGEATRGGGLNAFQKKLGSSYEEGFTRGGGSEQEESTAGTNTSEFTFKIVKKN